MMMQRSSASSYLSPIFIALVLGVAASLVGVPENGVTTTIYLVLETLSGALPVAVALTIGLMLRPIRVVRLWQPLLVVVFVKLILQPVLVTQFADLARLETLDHDVLLIQSAMPSGTIAAILAARYGCDGGFASAIVVATDLAAVVSAPAMVFLLAR